MGVILIGDVVLVDLIGGNALTAIRPAQNLEEATEEVGREFGSDLEPGFEKNLRSDPENLTLKFFKSSKS